MLTTLTIDADVLGAAQSLAKQQGRSVGQVISALAREGLQAAAQGPADMRNRRPLLPATKVATPATMELVNQLRDELP